MDTITYNEKINSIVDKVLQTIGKDITKYDMVEKQTICAFVFGVINAFSLEAGIDAVQIQGIVIAVFIQKFDFNPGDAAQFCDYLIQCTDKNFHPTINTIIHKGIDAFQYLDNPQFLGENIHKMINILKKAYHN